MTGTFRSKPSASQVKASRSYKSAQAKAQNYINDKSKLAGLVEQASAKAKKKAGGRLAGVWDSFTSSLRLVKAYAGGRYKGASVKTLVMIVAALLYFVMPADLIPDFLLGLGLIDDAALLAWTLQTLSGELDQFKNWEAEQRQKVEGEQ
ncbi:MAG: YkvA family protein [Limnobacter sp.]|nr:YkvA family protein [Limnobacter sp.]